MTPRVADAWATLRTCVGCLLFLGAVAGSWNGPLLPLRRAVVTTEAPVLCVSGCASVGVDSTWVEAHLQQYTVSLIASTRKES